ncbi:MAG: diaminopimelate epimerase [Planctomycetota bacterium]|nr:diaminopimelate epimerase [Planctomycetota bacterium]MCZ6851152.1 diaminopimelate epimerase [Planctomycetota bacterium]
MRFTKMHGIGNDYIYVNGSEESVNDPAALARAMADRHMGVGGDGLILILPSQNGVEADLRMRMFNADGTESAMCGNGIRCVCKYAHDHGLSKAQPMRIQTGTGVLTLEYTIGGDGTVDQVTVDMGEPILLLAEVPVDRRHLAGGDGPIYRISVDEQTFEAVFVSIGNPHAVIYVDDVEVVDLQRLGPKLEKHPAFPNRMNVHFVRVADPNEVFMRTWERGSGTTLACGSGACAVCVAGVITGRTDRRLLAHLPGGDLDIRWDERTNHVFMTGPAEEVFTGDWPAGGTLSQSR